MAKQAKRITFTLSPEHMAWIERIADAMGKRPGEVAREMVEETLAAMIEIFGVQDGEPNVSSERVLNRMYRLALAKMLEALDEVEQLP